MEMNQNQAGKIQTEARDLPVAAMAMDQMPGDYQIQQNG